MVSLYPLPLPGDMQRVHDMNDTLDRRFQNLGLLREALTHRSYLNETDHELPSNERMEFLGDAVLSMIATDHLYRRFPRAEEGELTNLRSALVRTETLARFAQSINLGHFLLLGRGEERSSGRFRPGGLACGFEALIGAVYLDQGYARVREFVLPFIEPELEAVIVGRLHRNAKSVLQEYVQARLQETPTYHLVEERGPDHAKHFTIEVRVAGQVMGRGHDRSKRGAEQSAAEAALEAMKSAAVESSV
jgi:ribonuclease III